MNQLRALFPLVPALALACGDGGPAEPPPAVATTVAIVPPSATLAALGQTVQLTARVNNQRGGVMTGVPITWAISDGSIATVNSGGLVTALGNGATTVTAIVQGGGPSASAALTVAQQTSEVRLSPTPEVFKAFGDTVRMSAGAFDANDNPIADADFNWSSSDESVVTVDATGLVTAAGNGSASVSAAFGAMSGSAAFSVAQQTTEILVSPAADTLRALGATLQMSAEARDANGYPVEGAEFTWSSGDESVVTVDATGLVTTIEPGSVEVTANWVSAGVTGAATLVVELRERDVLTALYHATNGPNWVQSNNWLTDAPLGSWHGVTTDSEGRVTGLRLRRAGLKGRLPPELGYLSSLRTLDFRILDLTGPIPPELGSLANLRMLSLHDNSLVGPLPPALGNLANLESLDLLNNDLTGPVPPELGSLAKLTELGLSNNALTGPIPPWLARLTSLRRLRISGSGFTGPIPPELGSLANLEQLGLSYIRRAGPIPPELGNLADLKELRAYNSNLTGPIPSELGNLANLEKLYLSDNNLSGPIPPELGNLANLNVLWVSGNNLTGPMPQELVNVPLTDFSWERTGLCAPPNETFQAWLRSIRNHLGGVVCAP